MEVTLLVAAGFRVARCLLFLFTTSAVLNTGVEVAMLVARGRLLLLLLLAVTAVLSALDMSGEVLAIWADTVTGNVRSGHSRNIVS